MNQPIGILDSGVGGLSIWMQIIKKLPNESTIYIADSKNCPYGSKSSEEIYQLSKKLVRFLLSRKVKLIVLACNTITVSCLNKLRKEFPKTPIIGTVPVVKTASEITRNSKIGVLSTARTAESNYQKNLIKKFTNNLKVLNLGTDKLVPIVESGEIKGARINKVLKETLKPSSDFNVDVLALGCSHFSFLRKQMGQILGKNVLILDSAGAIARQVERVLKNNNELSVYNSFGHTLYTTGDPVKFKKVAEALVRTKLKNVELVDL